MRKKNEGADGYYFLCCMAGRADAYLVYELTTSWLIAHTRMERASNHCGDTSRTLEVVSPMK